MYYKQQIEGKIYKFKYTFLPSSYLPYFYVIGMLLGDCPADHYQCSDKRCVRVTHICDGEKDCSDNGDEFDGCIGKINKNEFMLFGV